MEPTQLIDFKRGHQCITPTSKRYWKKNVCGRLVPGKLHYTRYMSNVDLNYLQKQKKDNGTTIKISAIEIERNGLETKIHMTFNIFHRTFSDLLSSIDAKESP